MSAGNQSWESPSLARIVSPSLAHWYAVHTRARHERVVAHRLRELGVSARAVQAERDGWILLQSASPKAAAVWFAEKQEAIKDPEFVAIYLAYDAAFGWAADDPRLEELAGRSARWFAKQGAAQKNRKQPAADPGVAQLIATSTGASSPAWDRLKEIAKERGAEGP